MGRHFFVFSYSTFHPQPVTLNIQHLTLFKRTPFAFQNESFYPSKGVLLHFKTSPFGSQKDYIWKRVLQLLDFQTITEWLSGDNSMDFILQPLPAIAYIYSPKSVSRMSPFFVRVSWKANAARSAQGSCPCDAMR